MFLDLEGLNCIRAHSILLVNLPNNRLVPGYCCSHDCQVIHVCSDWWWSHPRSQALSSYYQSLMPLMPIMITSIAMVKASEEMVHPAIIPTSKYCQVVLNSGVEKLNHKYPK